MSLLISEISVGSFFSFFSNFIGYFQNASLWAAITAIITLVYTIYTGRMVKGELGPKVYVKTKISDSKYSYDKEVMGDIGERDDFRKRGFSGVFLDKKCELTVINNGKYPAFDVEIGYNIQIFQYKYAFDKEDNLLDTKLVHFKTVRRLKKIDYLPPEGEMKFTVMFMNNLPKVVIEISELHSKGHKFIKKLVNVLTYNNSNYFDIEDADDGRRLIGLNYFE